MNVTINNRQWNLALKMQSSSRELMIETGIVGAFERSWSQCTVDAYCGTDDFFCQFFVYSNNMTSASSVSSVVKPLAVESAGKQPTVQR